MRFKDKNIYQILTLSVGLAIALGSMLWLQASVSPAAAQGLDQRAAVQVEVGETIFIDIIAEPDDPDQGIFGTQFEVEIDEEFLEVLSIESHEDMGTVVVFQDDIDNTAGADPNVEWVAYRDPDFHDTDVEPDENGQIRVATLELEALAEGSTLVDIQNWVVAAIDPDDPGNAIEVTADFSDQSITIVAATTADIQGNVIAGSAADQSGHTVEATDSMNASQSVETDENGDFVIADAPFDTYDVTASSPGYLTVECEGVVHAGPDATVLPDVVLIGGDVNGDGIIDGDDMTALGLDFGTAGDDTTDLNDDGTVNILDLLILSLNFGEGDPDGEPQPWPDCP